MNPTVLLTNSIHPDALATLQKHAAVITAPDVEAATLRKLASDADGIIVRAKLPGDIVDHAPRLKGIVRHGVGLDFIPVEAATRRKIPVANLPGSNTQAVAEYAFAALFQLRRRLAVIDTSLRTEGWNTVRPRAEVSEEIGGSTVGILGVGSIGGRVAQIAKNGFNMRVLGHSRSGRTLGGLVEAVDLDTLFAKSDAILVACALTEATRGLVSARLIGLMKKNAVLINISRGAVVETAALVAALRSGAIAAAALDVFDKQPLSPDDPLFDCPNLLLTPHIAGISATSSRAMSVGAVEEMLRILRGERPMNLVNPTIMS